MSHGPGLQLHEQRGSVLVIATVAMLVLGVLGLSLALLARLEVSTGLQHKAQAQAEALAEAGLERGWDSLRSAAHEVCGFTRWTDPAGASSHGCGTGLPKLLFDDIGLESGTYSAVVDNDCSPLVVDAIQDGNCTGGVPARDTNDTAVLTAWATATNGQGRARVRGLVVVDSPWKHVCASSRQDNPPGYCNEPGDRNGKPAVAPADPNEYPGGPAAYDDLPRPQLGCSAIDPAVHGESPGNCPPGQNYSYPYPGGKRLVVLGDRRLANCDGGGFQYQGYFDCALSTPCPPGICGTTGRAACVQAGDSRIDGITYVSNATGCGGSTGMVFRGASPPNTTYGAIGAGVLVYVMRGTMSPWTDAGCCEFALHGAPLYGSAVIEGNGRDGCDGAGRDLHHANGARAWAQPNVYGYPLAYLVFDPVEAVTDAPEPTASPLDPQEVCAAPGGGAGTEIHGLVYSAGHAEFDAIDLDGGVVAFEVQTRGLGSSYRYNPAFGQATPPPAFPAGAGNAVVLLRKSVTPCVNFAADTGGGSPCP
jgi:hypothetical protein